MKSIYCTLILLLVVPAVSAAQTPSVDSKPASTPAPRKFDKAAAYYHYTLAHTDSAMRTMRWRAEVNKHYGVNSEAVDAAFVKRGILPESG